ncbi:cobalamin B12-binding domain-containing protein [Clostridium formicaceticum]|uniref:Cobalamin-binding protein n=1 Tax=Clostridium formicaceticum TaxID=1497 RepID=A0AAC9RLX8_9CLOT|nr:cobalamin-dependent protein [Clostridium formicaceticum]AOY77839.1 cobalamin-binding protein [Clostridium formicaceticum]ARE88451.1 Methionine synthase [Clostridium formicaceticum]
MSKWDQLTKAVGELEEKKVIEILHKFINTNPSYEEVQKVIKACQAGMIIVGDCFEKGDYFVGDLIFSGELLAKVIAIVKPFLGNSSSIKKGKIVIGTVQGDLHDIGKNIFKSMVDAAGFEVYDIGIDQPVSAFVNKVREVQPDIVGMSGVLTVALEAMKDTVDGLKEAGLRDDIKVILGGNPVTKEACAYIGGDAYTANAAEGVKICRSWVV